MDVKDVTTTAMLVKLSIGMWRGTKSDAKVTKEVADAHGATEEAGHYTGKLYSKEWLRKLRKAENDARVLFNMNTLPWYDDGWRVVLAIHYDDLSEQLREAEEKFRPLVNEFIDNLEEIKERAKVDRGDMYDERDYLSRDEIKRRFRFEFLAQPIPTGADFRVDMSYLGRKSIAEEIDARVDMALTAAAREPWNRLHDILKRYVETLGKEEAGGFHYTLFTKAAELADLLPALNLSGDPLLDEMAKEVKRELAVVQSDGADERKEEAKRITKEVKKNSEQRAAMVAKANELLGKMAGYCGTA
jgi:hypothetical protein